MDSNDRNLGMNCSISRRDFLNGVALTGAAALLPESVSAQNAGPSGLTQDDPRYYPPALTGMRGSHPGSFEVAHNLRDSKQWDLSGATDTGERYDLVVVGGGLS